MGNWRGLCAVLLPSLAVWACAGGERGEGASGDMSYEIVKSDEEWRAQLTDEQYRITREKGTERAFSGRYWDAKTKGVYACVCCGQELYSSDTKYDSGTGWPSFWAPIRDDSVGSLPDRNLLSVRTEVVCSRCGAHLGHVFDDGPDPSGKRHCLNSAALRLIPEE